MGNRLTRGVLVMDNFMCQVHQPMQCSAIRSNIILDVSVRVFSDEINILKTSLKYILNRDDK